MVSTGVFVNLKFTLSREFWKYVPDGINACPGSLQVQHTLVQGRCNQMDACLGCTLKPVRGGGGVDKTDVCPGVTFPIIVICRDVCLNKGIAHFGASYQYYNVR